MSHFDRWKGANLTQRGTSLRSSRRLHAVLGCLSARFLLPLAHDQALVSCSVDSTKSSPLSENDLSLPLVLKLHQFIPSRQNRFMLAEPRLIEIRCCCCLPRCSTLPLLKRKIGWGIS